MRAKQIVTVVIIVLIAAAAFMGLQELFSPERRVSPDMRRKEAVGLINIDGIIAAGEGGLFSYGGGDRLQEEFRRAAKDPIKALVVRINSAGGSAAASQEIYGEIKKVRQEGKVVVVSMADMAASGGYMIACAADYIVANPATVTGSIGVFMDATNLQGLYDLLGIEYEVIKSGQFKDALNPARPLTDEERELLQAMIDDVYDQFVHMVAEGRGMGREEVLQYADGRILTGRQALEAGLVDELGSLYDSINIAAEMAGIEGEPEIFRYGRRSFWGMVLEGSSFNFGPLLSLPGGEGTLFK